MNPQKSITKSASKKRGKNGQKIKKVFSCKFCDKKFNNSSNCNKHMRIHTRETVAHCKICGKTFIDWSNLKKHQITHTGQRKKPFNCDYCNKNFAFKIN